MSPKLGEGETQQVMVRMDSEMHAAVKVAAAANDRSMAQEIRRAVRLYLESEAS